MDIYQLPALLSLTNSPMGLGGCRNDGQHFECCEYNITVLDDKTGESVHNISGDLIKIHHCSLEEKNIGILNQMQDITILSDAQWKLRMLLSSIREKKKQIALSHARSCLVDAGILANKARNSAAVKDPFAGVWIKCAAYFLADGIFCLNLKRPSPTHMLDMMRSMKKNKLNNKFEIVHQILGIERSSTSLLSRMTKSTAGFSDMVEGNGNSEIIKRKYEYLTGNSLLSDCHFYLGYVNRNNVLKIMSQIHRNQEYIHVLKVGLDIESDKTTIEKQAATLLDTTNEILADLKNEL